MPHPIILSVWFISISWSWYTSYNTKDVQCILEFTHFTKEEINLFIGKIMTEDMVICEKGSGMNTFPREKRFKRIIVKYDTRVYTHTSAPTHTHT